MTRFLLLKRCDTVDGRNPTLPVPGIYKTQLCVIHTVDGSEIPRLKYRLVNNGISTTNLNWCVDPGFLVGINNCLSARRSGDIG